MESDWLFYSKKVTTSLHYFFDPNFSHQKWLLAKVLVQGKFNLHQILISLFHMLKKKSQLKHVFYNILILLLFSLY